MSIFDKAKAAFATAKRAFTRVGTDLLKQSLHTGKALIGATPRQIGYKEQMQRMLGPAFVNGFERAPVRSANDGVGDTYGAKQRARKRVRRSGGINYRKQQNRVARALLKFHGAVAGMSVQDQLAVYGTAVHVVKRDPVSGVVS